MHPLKRKMLDSSSRYPDGDLGSVSLWCMGEANEVVQTCSNIVCNSLSLDRCSMRGGAVVVQRILGLPLRVRIEVRWWSCYRLCGQVFAVLLWISTPYWICAMGSVRTRRSSSGCCCFPPHFRALFTLTGSFLKQFSWFWAFFDRLLQPTRRFWMR